MLGFNMTHSQKLSSADLLRLRFECNFISILSWIVSPHLKACKTTNWKMEWLWRGYPPEESILDTANCTLCFLQWNELRNGNLFLHRGWKRGMSIAARRDGTSGCCKLLFNGKPCWNSEIWHMISWCKLPKITMPLILVLFHQWCLSLEDQLRTTPVPQECPWTGQSSSPSPQGHFEDILYCSRQLPITKNEFFNCSFYPKFWWDFWPGQRNDFWK